MAKIKKRHWFRAKDYGYGWGLPQTWEGWAAFLAFAIVLVGSLRIFILPYTENTIPPENLIIFFCILALNVFMLVAVSYRYGETPAWRWAGKPVKSKKTAKKSVRSKKR